MKTKSEKNWKVNVVTLGCSKNQVDSENIITQLRANDYEVGAKDYDPKANVVVVNTCGFIDLAKEESINTILHYAQLRSEGKIDKLYATGCLTQRYKDELQVEIPEVDAWFGTMDMPALLARFDVDYKYELLGERVVTSPRHYAYMKISEGCNRTCSFCAIPLMRGKHVSTAIEDLVKQAKHLARLGVKELLLIAQELTYYGLDIYKRRALSDLLNALSEVDGIEWIRLHYAYPSKFPKDVLYTIAAQKKVCNYLDMPLQHASDTVLKRMKRQITNKETRDLIAEARSVIPNLVLRTTMLVGFPGETEEEFEELVDFVTEMRFDRLGVFMYSHEEDTSAHLMLDDIPTEVKRERMERIMAVQRDISKEKNESLVGKKIQVLVDRLEGGQYLARTQGDSPEVDNEVSIDAKMGYATIGDFVEVEIIDAFEYDLIGRLVNL